MNQKFQMTVLIIILNVVFIVPSVFAANLLTSDNFEKGVNWNYSDSWNLHSTYLADEWSITNSNPHGGAYCAESLTQGSGYIEDSVFHFGFSADQLFIRFWLRIPAETVLDGDKENFLRFGTGSAGDWTDGIEYGLKQSGAWLFSYSDSPKYTPMSYSPDNQWHEYAYYIDFSNEIWRSWYDDDGTYEISNAVSNYENFSTTPAMSHVLLPWYFKGAPSGSDKFFIDDIEIWDGMPTSDTIPPSHPTGLSVSRN